MLSLHQGRTINMWWVTPSNGNSLYCFGSLLHTPSRQPGEVSHSTAVIGPFTWQSTASGESIIPHVGWPPIKLFSCKTAMNHVKPQTFSNIHSVSYTSPRPLLHHLPTPLPTQTFLLSFGIFETKLNRVAQSGLDLTVLLPQLPECWNLGHIYLYFGFCFTLCSF